MKYAVISSGNKQYKVAEGDTIVVDRLDAKNEYNFPQVLLFVDGNTRKVGTPLLADVVVSGKIVEDLRGPKIRVSKFKAKAKYRRVTGFRAAQTKVQILEIKGAKESKEPKESKVK